MNKLIVNAPSQSTRSGVLSLDAVLPILWESAVESFVRAILVLVFGTLALDLAFGIWQQMAPSRPPGFGHKLEAEATSSNASSAWRQSLTHHRFLIIFAVLFGTTLWLRFARSKQKPEASETASHLQRIGKHVSKQWFGLIVGNAFGAMISAFIVVWVQQFTFANMMFHWLLESVLAGLQNLAHHLLGASRADGVAAWFSWYGENQLKFTFWFFYLAAICDDLGIPNFKTLGHRLGRRARKRMETAREH